MEISNESKEFILSEIALKERLIKRFEKKYKSLDKLNKLLKENKIEEHPTWEDSIEWENLREDLSNLNSVLGM